MRHGRMVYVLGNVNGQFDMLDSFIGEIVGNNELLASMCGLYEENGYDFQAMILQCGDVAYFWPRYEIPEINNWIDWLPGGRILSTGLAEITMTGMSWTGSDPIFPKLARASFTAPSEAR